MFYVEIHSRQNPCMLRRHWFSHPNLALIRCYEIDWRFMLKFLLIYVVLVHVLRRNPHDVQNARANGRSRFSRHNLGPICRYETDRWFTLKFIVIYAILFMFYTEICLSQNPHMIGHSWFSRRNFRAPFAITKQIYDLRFLVHVLRKNPPKPELVHDRMCAGTTRGYTWLGLPGTNGNPELPLASTLVHVATEIPHRSKAMLEWMASPQGGQRVRGRWSRMRERKEHSGLSIATLRRRCMRWEKG
jgi:hypothetical protein